MTSLSPADRQLIHLFLDNEMEAAARRAFESRLEQEPPLAAALEAERQLRRQLQQRMRPTRAPESLRHSVAAQLAAKKQPFWSWWLSPQVVRPYQAALAALLLVLVTATALLWLGPAAPAESSVLTELSGKHALFLNNTGLLDVRGDPARVADWFKQRLPFAIAAPSLPELRLEGGRLGEVHHQPAAHLVFDRNGQDVSLTLFAPQPGDFNAGALHEIDGTSYRVGGDERFTVIIWQSGAVGYGLVAPANIPLNDLLTLARHLRNSPN